MSKYLLNSLQKISVSSKIIREVHVFYLFSSNKKTYFKRFNIFRLACQYPTHFDLNSPDMKRTRKREKENQDGKTYCIYFFCFDSIINVSNYFLNTSSLLLTHGMFNPSILLVHYQDTISKSYLCILQPITNIIKLMRLNPSR